MQKGLNKRGISPLIATVLLIGAAIGIFLIVFSLIKGVTLGTIEKTANCGAEEATSLEIGSDFNCKADEIEITVANNGQVKVEGFMFVFYNPSSAKSAPPTLNPTKPGEQSINRLYLSKVNDGLCPDKIEVYPGIVKEVSRDKAKFILCKDKKIEVSKLS